RDGEPFGGNGEPSGAATDGDLVLVALTDAAGRFDIPLPAFGELIDGCEADVRGTTYRTFDDLLHYCRCVAGSIGRLSLGVFGTADVATAAPLADALGVALQLTNILRDIREDYLGGRIYLPAEDFERFGCSNASPPPHTRCLSAACRCPPGKKPWWRPGRWRRRCARGGRAGRP